MWFMSKIKYSSHTESGQPGCCDFLFWFSSAILLFKMRSLFFNLSTSPNLNNSSIDYSEKYVGVYTLKRIPTIEFWYRSRVYGGSQFQSDKIVKQMANKY